MLNFTRQERVVVYFLVVTLSIGGILKYFRDRQLDNTVKSTRFYKEEQEFNRLAEEINSGEVTLIDTLETTAQALDEIESNDSSKAEYLSKRININTAEVDELSSLPGIGPVLAERIKAFIEANGPLKSKEEIILVKGIGDKLYARIQDLVTTE